MDRPEVVSSIRELREGADVEDETEAKQILAVKDDHVFVWNRRDFSILTISLNQALSQEDDRIQTFFLTDTPLFEVERVVPSLSGRRLCLHGRKGVMCVDLPRRSGRSGRFSSGQKEVTCRSSGVAERFFLSQQSRLVVQHVLWHPGSASDSHLAVLSSDNHLRYYNVEVDRQNPEQSIGLTRNGDDGGGHFFGEASLSVRASLGETAICFAFAPTPPEPEATSGVDGDNGNGLWPAFVLQGNGEILCVVAGLGAGSVEHRVFGPLTMYPSSPDNYGSSDSFCALLCLHPLISSAPPLLVAATAGGVIYHCVALVAQPAGEDCCESDTQSQVSQWSTTLSLTERDAASRVGLHVYESVELEIGLVLSAGATSAVDPFEYPLLLMADPTSPSRYFCSHKAGVHGVELPMVAQLAEMAQQPDSQRGGSEFPLAQQDSKVEHLVCTRLSPSSPPAPVLGLAVHYPPSQLICLLSDFSLQRLPLSSPAPRFSSVSTPLAFSSSGVSPIKKKSASDTAGRESFEERIRSLLRRESTLPRLRTSSSGADKPCAQEALDVLTRSTEVLREEYVLRQEAARAEIDRRARALALQKASQQSSLDGLNKQRHDLRERAADLSEAYEDLRDSGERLQGRLEVVLQRVQAWVEGCSDAELRMSRELRDLQRRAKDLSNALEQVRAKEKYQLRQVQEARRQRTDAAGGGRNQAATAGDSGSRNIFGSPVSSPSSTMGENQLNSIKEVLEQDSKEIADLVGMLNLAKRDLAI